MDSFSFDEYGFVMSRCDGGDTSCSPDDSEVRCHNYSPQPSQGVVDSWCSLLDSWEQHYKDSPQKLRQLLRKGVPHTLRPKVWQMFLNSSTLKAQSSFNYEVSLSRLHSRLQGHGISEYSLDQDVKVLNNLMEDPHQTPCVLNHRETFSDNDSNDIRTWAKTVRQIMMDVNRSFPQHRLFLGDKAPGIRALFRVLVLYTEYNPKVGYCQGMAYVGGLLLMSMEEKDAFWALVSLFDRPKYLSGYYDASMGKIQTHAEVFGLMLKEKLPQLSAHLEELGIHPLLYVTSWFLCIFTSLPCWDTVLAICDILFLEGINAIFRAALAIMKVCTPELMAMCDMGTVVHFLQHLPSRLVSPSNLLRVLRDTPVHSWEVELYVDVVHSSKESSNSTRQQECDSRSRKRVASPDHEPVHTPHEAKRRKKETLTPAPTPCSRSLLSRIKGVFTPARLSKPSHSSSIWSELGKEGQAPVSTALKFQLSETNVCSETVRDVSPAKFQTPSVSSRKRKRKDSSGGNLTVDSCDSEHCDIENIELKDFSRVKQSDQIQKLSPGMSVSPMLRLALLTSPLVTSEGENGNGPLGFHSPFSSGGVTSSERLSQGGRRRSVRIANRRSTCREGVTPGVMPSLSILSPRSVRPLQEHVQTTDHPREHHAFRMFTTPTPIRPHPLWPQHEACTLTPDVAIGTIASPEIELKLYSHH